MRLPGVGESRRAEELGARIGVAELIRRAALTVRCDDCDGKIIAVVAYEEGRPLAAAPGQGDRLAPERRVRRHWLSSWADRASYVHARIHGSAYRHVIPTDELMSRLPAQGAADETWRLLHRDLPS